MEYTCVIVYRIELDNQRSIVNPQVQIEEMFKKLGTINYFYGCYYCLRQGVERTV